MAWGHWKASSCWQKLTPRAFVRPPATLESPWVGNYVRIASFVSFLMALIPLPLHWTSEKENENSGGCHRLPVNPLLISPDSLLQEFKKKEDGFFGSIYKNSSFYPFLSSYWFTAVFKVSQVWTFLIGWIKTQFGAVKEISLNLLNMLFWMLLMAENHCLHFILWHWKSRWQTCLILISFF